MPCSGDDPNIIIFYTSALNLSPSMCFTSTSFGTSTSGIRITAMVWLYHCFILQRSSMRAPGAGPSQEKSVAHPPVGKPKD